MGSSLSLRGHTTPTTTNTSDSTGDDTSDASLDSFTDDSDVGTHLAFLGAKRQILQRAADFWHQSDIYDAATAVRDAQTGTTRPHKPSETPGTLYHQAKGIVRALNSNTNTIAKALETASQSIDTASTAAGDVDANNTHARMNVATFSRSGTTRTHTHTHIGIDLSSVIRVSAADFLADTLADDAATASRPANLHQHKAGVLARGPWIAQALVGSVATHRHGRRRTHWSASTRNHTDWKIVTDPWRGATGLLPPRTVNLRNALTLQQATALTEQPRLVTQSTPPFTVVYANRAFLQFAAQGRSPAHAHFDAQSLPAHAVVGQPVEAVLQVADAVWSPVPQSTSPLLSSCPQSRHGSEYYGHDYYHHASPSTTLPDATPAIWRGIVALSGVPLPCGVQVRPVVTVDRSATSRRSGSCVSHVAIRIRPVPEFSDASVTTTASVDATDDGYSSSSFLSSTYGNVGSDNADGDDDIDGTSTTRSNGSSRGADDEGQSYPRRYQRSHKHHRDGTRVVVGTVGETFEPPNATDRGSRPDADDFYFNTWTEQGACTGYA